MSATRGLTNSSDNSSNYNGATSTLTLEELVHAVQFGDYPTVETAILSSRWSADTKVSHCQFVYMLLLLLLIDQLQEHQHFNSSCAHRILLSINNVL